MIDVSVRKLIVNLFYYEITWSCQPIFSISPLQIKLKFTLHLLKYSQTLNMPVIYLRQKWEIISCVLFKHIVFDNNHLQLLHGKPRIHLNGTFIYQINNATLGFYLLTAILQVSTWYRGAFDYRVLHTFGFGSFFFFVLVQDCLEDLLSLFFAIVEAVVVGADDDEAEVDCEVTDVNMQDEGF